MSRIKLYKHYIKSNIFKIKDRIKAEQKPNKRK